MGLDKTEIQLFQSVLGEWVLELYTRGPCFEKQGSRPALSRRISVRMEMLSQGPMWQALALWETEGDWEPLNRVHEHMK